MQVFDASSLLQRDFEQILSFLRAGGVIGFPTDTAYGLGADPWNESAIREVFRIKGRDETKPLLVLVDSLDMMSEIATFPDVLHLLAAEFWPGPLTVIVPALESMASSIATAGTKHIGVRWPDAPFATRLVKEFKRPLTATSANRAGMQ